MSTTLYWNNLNNDGDYSDPTGWSYDLFGMSPYSGLFPTDAFFRFDGQHTNAYSAAVSTSGLPNCVGAYLGPNCTPSSIDLSYGLDIGTASEGGLLYLGYANLASYGTLVLQGTPSPSEIHGSTSESAPAAWLGNVTTYIGSYAVLIYGHVKILGITHSWTAVSYLGEPFIDVTVDSSLSIRAGAFSGGSSLESQANIGHFESSTLSASLGKVIWRCDSMMGGVLEYPPYVWANYIHVTTEYGSGTAAIDLPNIYYTAMTPTDLTFENNVSGTSQATISVTDDFTDTNLSLKGLVEIVPTVDSDFHPQSFSMQSTAYGNCTADFGGNVVDLQFRYLFLRASVTSGTTSFDRGDNALACAGIYVSADTTWTNGASALPIVLKEASVPFTFDSQSYVDIGDVEVNDTLGGSTFRLSGTTLGDKFMVTNLTVTAGIVQPIGRVDVSGDFSFDADDTFGSPTYLGDFRVTGSADMNTPVAVQNINCQNGSMLRCQKGGAWLAKHECPVYNSDLPRFAS